MTRTYAQEQQLHHLRRTLTNHRPDAEQINRIELIQAVMWAVKAIAIEEKVDD